MTCTSIHTCTSDFKHRMIHLIRHCPPSAAFVVYSIRGNRCIELKTMTSFSLLLSKASECFIESSLYPFYKEILANSVEIYQSTENDMLFVCDN
jgi:hypothetical protein